MISHPIFQCKPGDLLRIEFPQPLRGVTISALEVTVLSVISRKGNPAIKVLLKPFSNGCGELMCDQVTMELKLLISHRRRIIKELPVERVAVID